MSLQFTIGGRVVEEDELKRQAKAAPKAAPKPKAETDQKYHKGWRVSGHPPGAMEKAKDHADKAVARWERMSSEAQAEVLRSGEKPPKPWDEPSWRRNTALKSVRSKPYSVPEAAEVCREMAIKEGWLDVVVIEMKKGEAE